MRFWLAIACCLAATSATRAEKQPAEVDAVALLPLDAEKALELYGQPIAAELARALRGAHVEVVIVGANMTVPERARLIVRGKIVAEKGDALALSVQISDPKSGEVLEALSARAPKLTAIDRAAADLATRVVAAVRKRLARDVIAPLHEPVKPQDPAQPPPQQQPDPAFAFEISAGTGADPLRVALPDAIAAFASAHRFVARAATVDKLAGDAFGIAFEVRELAIDPREVPTARARVHVRITRPGEGSAAATVAWDRVIVTDTIVGEKGMAQAALAARVAREVLAIVQPHLRRVVPAWR